MSSVLRLIGQVPVTPGAQAQRDILVVLSGSTIRSPCLMVLRKAHIWLTAFAILPGCSPASRSLGDLGELFAQLYADRHKWSWPSSWVGPVLGGSLNPKQAGVPARQARARRPSSPKADAVTS